MSRAGGAARVQFSQEHHCPVMHFVDTGPRSEVAMADTGKMFSVLHIVLDSGERLPCLVDATTWIPARVALRWAMRYRRYRVQSSTLAANLRVLGKVYRWTTRDSVDLDDRLTGGRTLQNREIESLARSFRGAKAKELDRSFRSALGDSGRFSEVVSGQRKPRWPQIVGS